VKTSPTPIRVELGDPIYHRGSGNYLGLVTEVRSHTVRFDGPYHDDGLATRFEIYVGREPTKRKRKP
jgi:hypothetical protein